MLAKIFLAAKTELFDYKQARIYQINLSNSIVLINNSCHF